MGRRPTTGGMPQTAPQLPVRFPVLDTLRALGALGVLTTHTSFQTGEYLGNGVAGTLLARLDVGVAIFFVLSGFLLARPYLARHAAGLGPPDLRGYYAARALRILPVYLVTVLVAYVFVDDNDRAGVQDWLFSALLLNPFLEKSLPYGLTQMWSLSVEVTFYLALPWIMLLVLRRGSQSRAVPRLLGSTVVVSVLWLWAAPRLDDHLAGAPGLWLPAYLTWFGLGVGLAGAHLAHQRGTPSRTVAHLVNLGRQPGVCWSLAAGLMLVSATPLAGPTLLEAPSVAESMAKHFLYAGVGSLLVLSGVFALPGAYLSAMSWAPLRHVGHISYSVFCIHLVVLAAVFDITGIEVFTGHGLRVWFLTLGASLLAAEALYRWVELPALGLKKRWDGSSATRASSAATATTTK